MNRFMQWLGLKLEKWCERTGRYKIIYNNHPNEGDVYLIRYFVFTCPLFHIYLHRFMMSDLSVPHDHPFSFFGYIISGEYDEEILEKDEHLDYVLKHTDTQYLPGQWFDHKQFKTTYNKRKAGGWAYRPSTHAHVVRIDRQYKLEEKDKAPFTMIIRGPYHRNWGFWLKGEFSDDYRWEYYESYLTGENKVQHTPKDTEIEGVG